MICEDSEEMLLLQDALVHLLETYPSNDAGNE